MSKVLTIWKYPLQVLSTQTVELPVGAEIISANSIGDELFMWAIVDCKRQLEDIVEREICVLVTDGPYPEDKKLKFIDTAQMHDGKFICHIFEVLK